MFYFYECKSFCVFSSKKSKFSHKEMLCIVFFLSINFSSVGNVVAVASSSAATIIPLIFIFLNLNLYLNLNDHPLLTVNSLMSCIAKYSWLHFLFCSTLLSIGTHFLVMSSTHKFNVFTIHLHHGDISSKTATFIFSF